MEERLSEVNAEHYTTLKFFFINLGARCEDTEMLILMHIWKIETELKGQQQKLALVIKNACTFKKIKQHIGALLIRALKNIKS